MRIIFACDRSGGHLIPALLLFKYLKKDGHRGYIFVTDSRLKKNFSTEGTEFIGCGYRLPLILAFIFRFFEAIYLIMLIRPQRVIGFGGRDSFFILVWARVLGIHTSIYEPNIVMGRANMCLCRLVNVVYYGWERENMLKNGVFVGIPVRTTTEVIIKSEILKNLGLAPDKLTLLAFGGSQGSNFINRIIIWFSQESEMDFQVIHLTGEKEYMEIFRAYSKIERGSFVRPFYNNMNELYKCADIVVSRSGALTMAEISYFRKPAVLIPYPYAYAHQYINARYFSDREAAVLVTQDNFSFSSFKDVLEKLLGDADLRERLSLNMAKIKIAVEEDEFYKKIFN